jgi:O-antigen ligase
MLASLNLDKTYQYLLIFLGFLLPLTVFGANFVIVFICCIWLISGNYKTKLNLIFSSKLMLASLLFFGLHVVGMLWTEDLQWGLHIIHKMWYFFLLWPILFTLVKKDYIKYYVGAFLLAITFTEILSYLVWFEIIPEFRHAKIWNPTPFMSHISYNPILAFAIYLISHQVLFQDKLSKLKRYIYFSLAITMSINMFITGGRAGHVMYFVMLSILIFQYFNYKKIRSLILIMIVIPSVFYTAYQSSDIFNKRVDMAVENTLNYSENKGSSVGRRITWAINSWDIIKKNLIIGVGTGDLPSEYKKINQINSPELPNINNPHNMYTLVLIQLGLLGFFSFFSIFYYQIKLSFRSSDKYIRDTGITLPVLFLVIMFSDSYLLGHYTSLMFIFFSSFLYKDFEKT